MTPAAVLAVVAVLSGFAAAHQLLGGLRLDGRPSGESERAATHAVPRLATLALGRRAAGAALRLGLPERLRRSGLEGRLSLGAVLAGKLAGAAAGAGAALLAMPAAPGRTALAVGLAMPLAGFLVPDALLERRARRRHRRLLAALPDGLDLLAVGAAAGRGPAAGLEQIAAAGDGPLARELGIVVAEIGSGAPLGSALAALRRRVPGPELAALVAALERSRRFGSPLAAQLREQASALRREGRRATEERAARAAPKIQLVVALVLVPSVLLMIAAALIANADVLLAGF